MSDGSESDVSGKVKRDGALSSYGPRLVSVNRARRIHHHKPYRSSVDRHVREAVVVSLSASGMVGMSSPCPGILGSSPHSPWTESSGSLSLSSSFSGILGSSPHSPSSPDNVSWSWSRSDRLGTTPEANDQGILGSSPHSPLDQKSTVILGWRCVSRAKFSPLRLVTQTGAGLPVHIMSALIKSATVVRALGLKTVGKAADATWMIWLWESFKSSGTSRWPWLGNHGS